ncbi:DUF4087 domain-containing protein [Burkholderia pseudomallei]|nr:DUF4087 domain-containing protein [Burkholderia pseudomallei]
MRRRWCVAPAPASHASCRGPHAACSRTDIRAHPRIKRRSQRPRATNCDTAANATAIDFTHRQHETAADTRRLSSRMIAFLARRAARRTPTPTTASHSPTSRSRGAGRHLFAALAVALIGLPHAHAEIRCGWLQNPTPGNWWLDDRTGSWTLGTMGGPETEGMDVIPDMAGKQYVETNGSHGYACACLTVVTDKQERRIVKVLKAKQLPLSRCRRDKRLKEPT